MVYIHIQDALAMLKDDDKQQLLDNIEKWDCILGKGMDNQLLDLLKYSSIYCKLDCQVLMQGYEVFRGWMLEHTELDVDNFITIQSMASSFMLKSGCYDNVYQVSVVLPHIYTFTEMSHTKELILHATFVYVALTCCSYCLS